MRYRADIDGLRALAVLPVLLFHSGVPHFTGGYVGVDVFFVISGYLITSIIASEIQDGRFSIVRFYERRVRRIFPALFAVMLFSAVAAAFLLLPTELVDFGRSLETTTLFGSNVYFWRTSGYFDSAAELKPLLHTWSLAIEEQFYIVYPLLLVAAFRARLRWGVSTWIALVLSFGLSVYAVRSSPFATFYLLPTRAWELALGAVLALGTVPSIRHHWSNEALGLLGFALILGPVLIFDKDTVFPAANAAFPCLGAALLVHTGAGAPTTLAARVLSLPVIVGIGRMSYSLYLWHWPFVVTARMVSLSYTATAQAAVLVASFAAAYLSWRFIEMPFRERRWLATRGPLFGAAGVAIAAGVVAGLAMSAQGGWPGRLAPQVVQLAGAAGDFRETANPCMDQSPSEIASGKLCRVGPDGAAASVLLWGDSHVEAAVEGLTAAAERTHTAAWHIAGAGCPPLLGVSKSSLNPPTACQAHNEAVLRAIERLGIHRVILMSRWSVNAVGLPTTGPDSGLPAFALWDEETRERGQEENLRVFTRGLRRTVSWLHERGIDVTVLAQVPETGIDTPQRLARAAMRGRLDEFDVMPRAAHLARQAPVLTALAAIERDRLATIIDPTSLFCLGDSCRLREGNDSLYADDDHLSRIGSRKLTSLFAGVLRP